MTLSVDIYLSKDFLTFRTEKSFPLTPVIGGGYGLTSILGYLWPSI